jgi:hypothetical protein
LIDPALRCITLFTLSFLLPDFDSPHIFCRAACSRCPLFPFASLLLCVCPPVLLLPSLFFFASPIINEPTRFCPLFLLKRCAVAHTLLRTVLCRAVQTHSMSAEASSSTAPYQSLGTHSPLRCALYVARVLTRFHALSVLCCEQQMTAKSLPHRTPCALTPRPALQSPPPPLPRPRLRRRLQSLPLRLWPRLRLSRRLR